MSRAAKTEIQPHELMVSLVDVIRETSQAINYQDMKKMAGPHLDSAI